MNRWTAVLLTLATLLSAAAPCAAQGLAAPGSRGQMLYANHCVACHSTQMHWRDKRLVTVTGMIRTFKAITVAGVGNPAAMASGIAEALITTAAGLIIAIPALVAYRYLRGRVDGHVIDMEKESLKLVQAIDRASTLRPASAVEIGVAMSSPPDAQEAVA